MSQSEPKKVKVVLLKDHIHSDVKYVTGDTIEVREADVPLLVAFGVIKTEPVKAEKSRGE